MKTFLSEIFPKIKRYSEKMDNLTLLTDQHWVSIDDEMSNKTVFIFRSNNELLVSTNGKVIKEKWEFLGNKSLLIEKERESYLFKHGFFDENILALKVDSREEYAVFVNENKYEGELNSIQKVFDFLNRTYLKSSIESTRNSSKRHGLSSSQTSSKIIDIIETNKGKINVEVDFRGAVPTINDKVFQNGVPAKNGKYKLGFMNYILIRDGIIVGLPIF